MTENGTAAITTVEETAEVTPTPEATTEEAEEVLLLGSDQTDEAARETMGSIKR
jgi:hypothetical protein